MLQGIRLPIRAALIVLAVVAVTAYAYLMVQVNNAPRSAVSSGVRSDPQGALDSPAESSAIYGHTEVRGWAIDAGAPDGTGVDRVWVFVDGNLTAEATYGEEREDIAARLGRRFRRSGWSARVSLDGVSLGDHHLEARAYSAGTGEEAVYSSRIAVVRSPSLPSGSIDAPAANASLVSGEIDVRGWALDAAAAQGSGVDRVQLFLDGVPRGEATYGLPRDDVAAQFGARFRAAGWLGQVDLRGLELGPHTLEARVHSTYTDQLTSYTQTIVLTPQPSLPSGAVDAPGSGARVSGLTQVAGWAVDEATSAGPGVDSVELFVDGRFVDRVEVGQRRDDIAASYGELFRDSGWAAVVDFRQFSNGQHTLEARALSSYNNEYATYRVPITVEN